MALVIDASALLEAFASRAPSAREVRRRLGGETVHAPHLIDAEMGNAMRRHIAAGGLHADDGVPLLDAAALTIDVRHPVSPGLRAAAWQLRANLTFYDALYAALAGALELPLVTADGRLARAPDLRCAVQLLPA